LSPITNKPKDERKELIEELRVQVEKSERRGHFDTAHHQMLRELQQPQPKETVKETE
jgi:hypothetical protein